MRIAVTNYNDSMKVIQEIRGKQTSGKPFTVEILDGLEAKRSIPQNSGLHVYCRELALRLNESGYDMRKVLKQGVDIPWDEKAVKKHLWKPVQKAMLNTESTTELTRKQVSEVYEVLNRHLAEKFGVSMPFPHREEV